MASYVNPEKVYRYSFPLNEKENRSLQRVIAENGIKDVSKALRYCIDQEIERLDTANNCGEAAK